MDTSPQYVLRGFLKAPLLPGGLEVRSQEQYLV